MNALEVYEHRLRGSGGRLRAVTEAGRRELPLGVERWLGPLTADDETVLDRVREPVLDVGCGPGRHVIALAHRGVLALGVDVSPVAVRLARSRGAMAIQGSVFDRVPGIGAWGSVLLLDGNLGIGGHPRGLLRRLVPLLASAGRVLVELEPGVGSGRLEVRLHSEEAVSEVFPWAHVGVEDIDELAATAGLRVQERWKSGARAFAALAVDA